MQVPQEPFPSVYLADAEAAVEILRAALRRKPTPFRDVTIITAGIGPISPGLLTTLTYRRRGFWAWFRNAKAAQGRLNQARATDYSEKEAKYVKAVTGLAEFMQKARDAGSRVRRRTRYRPRGR
jgi:hypothetical protein